ncbi:MAG: NRDE family protein [Rhodospirillaceae bacterium]|nr:NRDE family protein [Rhodospirillaceae bacterium]
MCTVVLLRRPTHDWPILLAANRDEMLNRPWLPPGRHWPDRPHIVGGLDELAGGTWMGMNETGVVACILNRHGTLGPQAQKRSRGELVLEALDHADATDAAAAIHDISLSAYRPFNMVIADNRDAWWLALRDGATRMLMERIPDGLSMFTAGERNDTAEPRIGAFLPRFEHATPPEPLSGKWDTWAGLMGATDTTGTEHHAMTFKMASGFGTSSSSLVALPSMEAVHNRQIKPIWLFAAGRPDSTAYQPVIAL